MNAKRMLYEGIVVPTALYGEEMWGLREAEQRKQNVLEMGCLRIMWDLLFSKSGLKCTEMAWEYGENG